MREFSVQRCSGLHHQQNPERKLAPNVHKMRKVVYLIGLPIELKTPLLCWPRSGLVAERLLGLTNVSDATKSLKVTRATQVLKGTENT